MKNKTIQAILIIALITTVTVVIGQYLIRKFTQSMLLSKLVPFIQKKEGGLSRDPDDNASAYPAPWAYKGQTGWHTNKGVTYQAFKGNAAKGGYAVTADNFFTMPDKIWLAILKNGYMSPFPLDEIDHLPRIQAVITTWAWGSGVGGAEKRLANFQRDEMGIQDSNITPTEIVSNFKRKVNPLNEKLWFNKLCDRRAVDFSKMADYPKYKNGWLSRLEEFRKLMA